MWTGNIQVMYCPAVNDTDHFYVYKLIHSVYCDSAYCAIDRSDVQSASSLFTTRKRYTFITSTTISAILRLMQSACVWFALFDSLIMCISYQP